MGQGAESCGAYDYEYDPYEDGLVTGEWTQRDGTKIALSDMTLGHLHAAKAVAFRASRHAQFSSDGDKFEAWVSLFDAEIKSRKESAVEKRVVIEQKKAPDAAAAKWVMVTMQCHCGKEYQTRKVDLDRGWGLSCSKSCAARRRYNPHLLAAKPKGSK